MKSRMFYTALLLTVSNLAVESVSYGSEREQTPPPKSEKELREESRAKALAENKDAAERVKKRSAGRKLQEKGKELEKKLDAVIKPMSKVGTAVGLAASASGDPNAKMGAMAFKLSIMVVEKLGDGIAQVIKGVGRYQERSQKILSNVEVLLEDLQKSIDKITSLEKKRKELLAVEKPSEPVQRIGYDLLLMSELPKNGKPKKGKIYLEKLKKNDPTLKDSELKDSELKDSKLKDSKLKYILMQSGDKVVEGTLKIKTPKDLTPEILKTFESEILEMITKEGYTASKSESLLKKLGKGALGAAKTAEIKVRQAADILTNDKADREEKLKAIQADLKIENENYEEIIRLLQIMLMEDTVKEVDNHIHIISTIASLEEDAEFYREAKEILSRKSKQKKKISEIVEREAQNNKNLVYYQTFRKSIPESDEALQDPLPTTDKVFGKREDFIKKLPENHAIKKLVEDRSTLENKIEELTQLTKMGDAIYLQKKEVQLDSELNRAAIVSLYRENDVIKNQLEALKNQLEALRATLSSKAVQPPPMKKEASQREALAKEAPPRDTGPVSEEMLRKQRDSLRPIPTTPQGR